MPERNTAPAAAPDEVPDSSPAAQDGPPGLADAAAGGGDPVLDAARATVLDFGVRRATLTEVARRAGLSRMTVYRRYADGNQLMRALMSREFGAVLVQAENRAAEVEDPLERVVIGVGWTLEMLMEHPLMRRLLELEPEMLLPYLTDRVGEFQRAGRRTLAAWIATAQQQGAIRDGDPERLASTVELAARGLVLSARTYGQEERKMALSEHQRMIRGYLRQASGK
jgi:AcrR family transcriptional regulator